MAGIEAILAEIWAERKAKPPVGDFLEQIYDSYADLPDDEREVNAARDVIVIRMAQRSITLRQVVKPMTFTVAEQTDDLAPGVLVTTMLSNTNTNRGAGSRPLRSGALPGSPTGA